MSENPIHCGYNMFSEGRKPLAAGYAVDTVNNLSLGLEPAYSTDLSYLSTSINGQLIHSNMVADQQRQAMLSLAIAVQAATGKKLGKRKTKPQPNSGESPVEKAMAHAERCVSSAEDKIGSVF